MFNAIIHVPFSRKIIRDSHDLISENEFSFLASSKLFDFFFRLPLSVMLSDSYVSVLKMTENKAEQIAISEMFKHHICDSFTRWKNTLRNTRNDWKSDMERHCTPANACHVEQKARDCTKLTNSAQQPQISFLRTRHFHHVKLRHMAITVSKQNCFAFYIAPLSCSIPCINPSFWVGCWTIVKWRTTISCVCCQYHS